MKNLFTKELFRNLNPWSGEIYFPYFCAKKKKKKLDGGYFESGKAEFNPRI